MTEATSGQVNGADFRDAYVLATSSSQEAERHRRVAKTPIAIALFLVDAARETTRARALFSDRSHMMAALGEEVGELAEELLKSASPGRRGAEAMQVACVASRIATENDADFEGEPPRRFKLLAELYVALGRVARGLIEGHSSERIWGVLTELVSKAEQLGLELDANLSPKRGADVVSRIAGRIAAPAFALLEDDNDHDGGAFTDPDGEPAGGVESCPIRG